MINLATRFNKVLSDVQGDVGPEEILFCEQKRRSLNIFAVASRDVTMISLGTFPEQFHTWCFIQHRGSILCEVTGNPQYSRDLSTPSAEKLACL